jgi:hypothetical protein
MSEASKFRQYAEEAVRASSKAADENDKRALTDLACIWAQAAAMSEKMFGSSFKPDVGEATPLTGS